MSIVQRARVAALVISLSLLPSVAHAQAAEAVAVPATAPVALKPLYGSFVGLQAFDFYSTRSVITSGVGREGNPALREVAGLPAALLVVKAGTTAAIILSCERLRKNRHPVAAVALMIGVNSAYAFVAAHNYTVLQHRR
ncbi:MAG TPA: DUF5658 family protein [Vicinamibacterales bacterium]